MAADEKRCNRCGRSKPLDDFSRRAASADGRQPRCKDCWRAWYVANRDQHIERVTALGARRAAENRARLADFLLAHPCVDCGESDLRVLDFDHVDPAAKSGVISRMVFRCSWRRIASEIDKCVVRCASCHRRRTAEQFGWWSATRDRQE